MPAPEPDGHVYVFQVRLQPKGKRTKYDPWETKAAYLTEAEALAHATVHKHRYPLGWRVQAVPAVGRLMALLRTLQCQQRAG